MPVKPNQMLQNIAVVSVDMFQTLVNVDTRCHPFWQRVLGPGYTYERAEAYWPLLKVFLQGEYRELFAQNHSFIRARLVAERSFKKLFAHLDLKADPALAAEIFVKEHGLAAPFDDAADFLHKVGDHFPICLVSDADEEMIGPLRSLYHFDYIFTSEQTGAYKSSPGGELFRAVVEHFAVAPQYILHIGDSFFDVLGAGQAGLLTCWLNRFNRAWEHEIRPHLTVSSLAEAASLLRAAQ